MFLSEKLGQEVVTIAYDRLTETSAQLVLTHFTVLVTAENFTLQAQVEEPSSLPGSAHGGQELESLLRSWLLYFYPPTLLPMTLVPLELSLHRTQMLLEQKTPTLPPFVYYR